MRSLAVRLEARAMYRAERLAVLEGLAARERSPRFRPFRARCVEQEKAALGRVLDLAAAARFVERAAKSRTEGDLAAAARALTNARDARLAARRWEAA